MFLFVDEEKMEIETDDENLGNTIVTDSLILSPEIARKLKRFTPYFILLIATVSFINR